MEDKDNRINGSKRVGRDEKTGKFLSGNNFGGNRNCYKEELMEAVKRQEDRTGKLLFDRFVEMAFTNRMVMIALMKKFIPDLKNIEVEKHEKDKINHIVFTQEPTQIEIAFANKYMVGEAKEKFLIEYEEVRKKELDKNKKTIDN